MTQPTPYNRSTSFATDQAAAPLTPLAGANFDTEFNAAKVTLDQVLANLAVIQRDDTQVANQTIGYDQLKPELSGVFHTPTAWVTGHAYTIFDSVFYQGVFYRCLASHTSGVFATDLGNNNWQVVADYNSITAGVLHGTSASAVTIGTGSKTFITQTSLAISVGASVLLAWTADPTQYLAGQVTAYSNGTVTFNVTNIVGSGSHSDWQVFVTGVPGAKGSDETPILVVFDGAGAGLSAGIRGDITVSFAGTILSARLLADQIGSIVVDIWKNTFANYPPTVADTITAAAKPTLSAALKSEDTTLTGWNTTINAGDTLRFNIDSVNAITRATLSLRVRKT
jgi:hypothetical protein